MPPTLYLVRHAEGEHNVNRRHHLRDPPLTHLGHEQCGQLRGAFPDNDKVSLVLASPLKRTIQTASYCFGAALARPDVPFLLVPLAQEVAANPCDTGFPADELRGAVPELVKEGEVPFDLRKIDFGLVEEGWNSKSGIYKPSFPAVERRATLLRAWLRARPEENVVLVTHGAFLHYLMEDWSDYDPKKGTGFCNCEVRRYGFADDGSLVALEGPASEEGYVKGARPDWVNKNVLSDIDPEVEEARL
ncbi:Ubiquitin-conjugating enzyme E2 [Botryosphaeria dothidea]|uniref:Ubiquitin-conjugating enzyme E2 n=1 Tax=Botryosphaeria dothidea TaxID=55169 RepID=A0A8H4J6H8_9PEZI|nr:Ubiquitin-conjugating enzyme E2 [Botryosphaeria dothidea]